MAKKESFKNKGRSRSFNKVTSTNENTQEIQEAGKKRSTSEEQQRKPQENDLQDVSSRKHEITSSLGSEENLDVDDYYVRT